MRIVEHVLLAQKCERFIGRKVWMFFVEVISFVFDEREFLFGFDFEQCGIEGEKFVFMESCLNFLGVNDGARTRDVWTWEYAGGLHFADSDVDEGA